MVSKRPNSVKRDLLSNFVLHRKVSAQGPGRGCVPEEGGRGSRDEKELLLRDVDRKP
jgi:hypothetical protein